MQNLNYKEFFFLIIPAEKKILPFRARARVVPRQTVGGRIGLLPKRRFEGVEGSTIKNIVTRVNRYRFFVVVFVPPPVTVGVREEKTAEFSRKRSRNRSTSVTSRGARQSGFAYRRRFRRVTFDIQSSKVETKIK